ncbi:MAG: LptF/LptG family permease [Planctomycetota bacterium]
MIKTLHGYISRDLAKVSGLALVAFTSIMTIFAIVEPLRREGLAAGQSLTLIGFTLPMMMSLTLPIAALFAATIVYGRFAQDNELMACRASGISTITLLRPALVLGAIVTVLSLILNSFVTPKMAGMLETTIMANVRSYTFSRLKRKNHFDIPGQRNLFIHADSVDEKNNILHGVVVAYTRHPEDVRLLSAPKARVDFTERSGETYLTVELIKPAVNRTGSYDIVQQDYYPLEARKLPSPAEEEPSWYDWTKLLRTLENPTENREIEKYFEEQILRALCHDMLVESIVSSIQDGKTYSELQDEEWSYRIRAGSARMGEMGAVNLQGTRDGEDTQPVEVTVFRNGEPYQLATADNGRIETTYSALSEASLVSIELLDNVEVRSLQNPRSDVQHRTQFAVGQLPVPERFVTASKTFSLLDVIDRSKELTSTKFIQKRIRILKEVKIPRLVNKIKAEMHMRAAYSLSCFMMVAMGAALGLMFKGGQFVSAFAISVIPAALVIVMMITGKQILHSRSVAAYLGLMTIWGGVLLLLAANFMIYFALSRK